MLSKFIISVLAIFMTFALAGSGLAESFIASSASLSFLMQQASAEMND